MNIHYERAVEQLEGMLNHTFPDCHNPGDEDTVADHAEHINSTVATAARIGSFMALVGINHTLIEMLHSLSGIEAALARTPKVLGLHVHGTTSKDRTMPPIAGVSLDLNHNLALAVSPKDADGNEIADTLSWSADNSQVIHLQPAADGLSCMGVTASPGTAVVSVTDGVNTDSVTVTVIGVPVAASLNLATSVVAK